MESPNAAHPGYQCAATITVVGALPPPVHGAALITEFIADKLGQRVPVQICDVSPGSLKRGAHYHLTRFRKVFAAARQLASNGFHASGTLYMCADADWGILYNIFLAAVARIPGQKLFVHHHSFAYLNRYDWRMALLVRICGPSSTQICLCPEMERCFRARYGAANLFLLSNAAFYPPKAANNKPNGRPLLLGHMSNLSVEKGLDTVLDVFRALRKKEVPVNLVLAGPVVKNVDYAMINDARAEYGDACGYRGPVYGEDKDQFFRDIDVFLFPTRYVNEAEPTVIYEAMARGIPVIAYGRGCIQEQLSSGGGSGIPPGDDFVAEAVPILANWATDPSSLAQASDAALARVRCCNQEAAQQLNKLLHMLCSTNFPTINTS